MALIECHGLYKDFAGTVVLGNVDFAIQPGEKVGLVGSNGAGKSTLLNILTGSDEDYRGALVRSPAIRLGYLPQNVEPPGEETALDYLIAEAFAARMALRKAEEALASASDEREGARLMKAYELAYERHEALGGDFAEKGATRALALVGLAGRETTRAASLSGGERGTLALARALQGKPDLLILDEPGNHLDFWGLAWLEDFLASCPAAVLIVSHNRMLLDRTVSRIVDIRGGRSSSFSGNYSAWRLARLREAAAQGADWQASKKRIERLEEMVRVAAVRAAAYTKHSAKSNGSLGQKLRARRRQLERAKAAATDRPELGSTAITASFAGRGAADAKSDYALIVDGYSRAFGERILFDGAGFDVLRGERVAIVGPNGCGKTTFLRDLVDEGSWDSATLRLCPAMKVGYVAQDRDGFRRGRLIREEFASLGASEAGIRGLLRDFGFGRDDPDRRIDSLSGGELNRLQLARAIFLGASFLILDEPTNHLDIDARESVEEKLLEFDGTILVVSHDRYFLDKVAERIVFVHDAKFEAYEGSFSGFWAEQGASLRPGAVKAAAGQAGGSSVGTAGGAVLGRSRAMARAKAARPGEGETLEARIIELEDRKGRLEADAKAAFDRRDFRLARSLANELEELHRDIDRLYSKWT